MIIQCAKCGTQFRLDESKMQNTTKVRCSKCSHTFVVDRPAPLPPSPKASRPQTMELPALPSMEQPVTASMAAPVDDMEIDLDVPPPPPLVQRMTAPAPSIPSLELDMTLSTPAAPPLPPMLPGRATTDMKPEPPLVQDDFLDASVTFDSLPPTLPPRSDNSLDESRAATAVRRIPQEILEASKPKPDTSPPDIVRNPAAEGTSLFGSSEEDLALPDESDFSGGLSADGTFEPPVLPIAKTAASPEDVTRTISRQNISLLLDDPTTASKSTAPRVNTAPEPVPPEPVSATRHVAKLIVQGMGSLAVVAALVVLGLTYLAGGKMSAALFKFDSAYINSLVARHEVHSVDGLDLTSMRSVLYPTVGGTALVFFGSVINHGSEKSVPAKVTAVLSDRMGRTLRSGAAPLGVELSLPELSSIKTEDDANALFVTKLRAQPVILRPGASAKFTIVLLDPPPQLENLIQNAVLEGDYTPAAHVGVAPTAPVIPIDDIQEAAPTKTKGWKAKMKGKGKMKAKTLEPDVAP